MSCLSSLLPSWNKVADERDVFYASKMDETNVAAHNAEVLRRRKEEEERIQKEQEQALLSLLSLSLSLSISLSLSLSLSQSCCSLSIAVPRQSPLSMLLVSFSLSLSLSLTHFLSSIRARSLSSPLQGREEEARAGGDSPAHA